MIEHSSVDESERLARSLVHQASPCDDAGLEKRKSVRSKSRKQTASSGLMCSWAAWVFGMFMGGLVSINVIDKKTAATAEATLFRMESVRRKSSSGDTPRRTTASKSAVRKEGDKSPAGGGLIETPGKGLARSSKTTPSVSRGIGRRGSGKLKRPTLVLDLDETLIHASFKCLDNFDLRMEVVIDRVSIVFYVLRRPYLDMFLDTVSEWYNVVVWTASLKAYADPLIDLIDPYGRVSRRLFRDSCTKRGDNFVKDLEALGFDLDRVVFIDNCEHAYSMNQDNAIPIEAWYNDPSDEALLNLLPFLNCLRFTEDVRSILGLRLMPSQ